MRRESAVSQTMLHGIGIHGLRDIHLRGAVAISAFVVCLAPANAAGSALVRLHAEAEGAPVWSGADVLVLVHAGRGLQVRLVDPASGASSVVASVPHSLGAAQLAGSPALIGVEQADLMCNEQGCKYEHWSLEGGEVLAGPPGATLGCLAGFGSASCAGLRPCYGVSAAIVSGSRIAYQECVDADIGRTVVVDYATTPPTRTLVPQVSLPESMSGPWLVGLSPGWDTNYELSGPGASAVVERNLETGAEPLHIELHEIGSEFPAEQTYPALAGVQEDGRIAYVVGSEEGPESVFTASPAEPLPRKILAARVSPYSRQFVPDRRFFFADGMLALEEELPPYRYESPLAPQRIALANVAGERLGEVELSDNEELPFDFNGSEVAGVETPCVESFMFTWGAGQPPPPRPPDACPSPRLDRIALARHGLDATLSCPDSPPLGCPWPAIEVQLRVRGRHISSRGQAEDMLPGARTTVTAPLVPRDVRWLRGHPGVPVGVQIQAGYGEPTRTRTRLR